MASVEQFFPLNGSTIRTSFEMPRNSGGLRLSKSCGFFLPNSRIKLRDDHEAVEHISRGII